MAEKNIPHTRLRASRAEISQQQNLGDSSSDSESLNNTLVERESNINAANTSKNLLDTPGSSLALPPPLSSASTSVLPQPFATEEVFTSLMSTMTSLKSAICELRQDACRNNNEIASLRSQLWDGTYQLSHPQNVVKNSMQSMPYTHESTPPNVHQWPPPTRSYLPPTNFMSTNTQPPSNFISADMQQVPFSTNFVPMNTKLPPSTNTQQPINIMSNSTQPPSNFISAHREQVPFSTNFVPMNTNFPPSSNTSSSSNTTNFPTDGTSIRQGNRVREDGHFHSEFSTKFYHLPNFDGKPEDWPLFLATFNDTTFEFGYSNRQNLMRLQRALQGHAKDSVLSMMIYPENVPQIMDELQFNFGRPELLIKSQLEKVKVYPAVTEGRLDGILGLATCAKNIVAFFKSAKCENHLMNPTLLEQLVLKLPLSKQYEWAKFSVSVLPFPTVEHFAKWVGDLARFCSLMPQRNTAPVNDRQQPSSTTRRVLHSNEEQPGRKECHQCKGGHDIIECQKFRELSTNAKWEQVKRFRVCFACLRKGHNLTQCRKKKICAINGCNRYHHSILHQDISDTSAVSRPKQTDHVLQCHGNESTCQLFKILPVILHGPKGAVTIYALLDEGSSVSLLEDSVANSIGLKGQKSSITLQWYDNMRKTESSMRVSVEISQIKENGRKYVIRNLHTVKELNLPSQSFNKFNFDYLKHLPIEDYNDKKPSMLIGLDNCFLGVAEQVIEAGPHLPVAAATKLGWVAYGPTARYGNNIARICHINDGNTLMEIHKLVEDYFSIENFGVKATNFVLESDDNKRAREILEKSTEKIESRYETGLLWKSDDTVLPDSFEMARQRLSKVENRMQRDPVYAANYKSEINKYIDKGYAKLLPISGPQTDNGKLWYLPHFGVTNPHKPGKLRIVFDAAAKSSDVSLTSSGNFISVSAGEDSCRG